MSVYTLPTTKQQHRNTRTDTIPGTLLALFYMQLHVSCSVSWPAEEAGLPAHSSLLH